MAKDYNLDGLAALDLILNRVFLRQWHEYGTGNLRYVETLLDQVHPVQYIIIESSLPMGRD